MSAKGDYPAARLRKNKSTDKEEEGPPGRTSQRRKIKKAKEAKGVNNNSTPSSSKKFLQNFLNKDSGDITVHSDIEGDRIKKSHVYHDVSYRTTSGGKLYMSELTIEPHAVTPSCVAEHSNPGININKANVSSMPTSNKDCCDQPAMSGASQNIPSCDGRISVKPLPISTSVSISTTVTTNTATTTNTGAFHTSVVSSSLSSTSHELQRDATMGSKQNGSAINTPVTVTATNSSTSTASMGTTLMHEYNTACQRLYAGQNALLTSQAPSHHPESYNNAMPSMYNDVLELKLAKNNVSARMDGLEFEQENDHETLQRQGETIQFLCDKVDIMSKLLMKQENQIDTIKARRCADDAKPYRANLKIVGLMDQDGKNPTELVNDFFKNMLQISQGVEVVQAYRLKFGDPAPIIAKLKEPKMKQTVFDKVSNLKGKKNKKDQYYGVYSHLPDHEMELDMRKRNVVKANKKLPKPQQQNIELKIGDLMVNGHVYSPRVTRLSARELLEIGVDDWKAAATLNHAVGNEITADQSHFLGFAVEVHNIHDVVRSYHHYRLKYADATHVMMAYRLPGINKAYDEDYFDDEEYGGGRRLHRLLVDGNVFSAMLVVVRYFGQKLLGAKRFDHIQATAGEALSNLQLSRTSKSSLMLKQTTKVFSTPRPRRSPGGIPTLRHTRPTTQSPHPYRGSTIFDPPGFTGPAPCAYNRFMLLLRHTSDEEDTGRDSHTSMSAQSIYNSQEEVSQEEE